MKVVIEFYRVRAVDDARAKVGHVSRDVISTEAAIEMAASLRCSLAMPQEPDIVTISDDQGNAFYRAAVGSGHVAGMEYDAREISIWENEGGAVACSSLPGAAGPRSMYFSPSNANEVSDHDTHFPQ
jgi:hypothetical protein